MDGAGQKQRMDQIQDLGMCLWEEGEKQHGEGKMQADPLAQAGGRRGRRMGLCHRDAWQGQPNVPLTPHQGMQSLGRVWKASAHAPVPGGGEAQTPPGQGRGRALHSPAWGRGFSRTSRVRSMGQPAEGVLPEGAWA